MHFVAVEVSAPFQQQISFQTNKMNKQAKQVSIFVVSSFFPFSFLSSNKEKKKKKIETYFLFANTCLYSITCWSLSKEMRFTIPLLILYSAKYST
jgi:hypothetical protein